MFVLLSGLSLAIYVGLGLGLVKLIRDIERSLQVGP